MYNFVCRFLKWSIETVFHFYFYLFIYLAGLRSQLKIYINKPRYGTGSHLSRVLLCCLFFNFFSPFAIEAVTENDIELLSVLQCRTDKELPLGRQQLFKRTKYFRMTIFKNSTESIADICGDIICHLVYM